MPDHNAGCRERPSAALVEAIRLFNAGHYRACTRVLVPLWNGEPAPRRFLYRGLAQAAAGLFHLSRHNPHGCTVKLASAVHILRQLEPRCLGIDVTRLVGDLDAVHARVAGRSPAELAALDLPALPQIHWAAD